MKKFIIGYGLSGGYGGIHSYEIIETDSSKKAEEFAWESACQYYESYIDGINLRNVVQIMEEDEVDEETAYEIFSEEREDWLDYVVFDYSELQNLIDQGYTIEDKC